MKLCNVCNTEKEDSEYYPNLNRNQCINCYRSRALGRARKCSDNDKNAKLERIECIVCKLKVTFETAHHFEWNHRDPSEKKYTVSSITQNIARYTEEIKKCDLVCLFCHADITKEQRKNGVIKTKPCKY